MEMSSQTSEEELQLAQPRPLTRSDDEKSLESPSKKPRTSPKAELTEEEYNKREIAFEVAERIEHELRPHAYTRLVDATNHIVIYTVAEEPEDTYVYCVPRKRFVQDVAPAAYDLEPDYDTTLDWFCGARWFESDQQKDVLTGKWVPALHDDKVNRQGRAVRAILEQWKEDGLAHKVYTKPCFLHPFAVITGDLFH